MIEYMHELPGRLRIRSPLFRKNLERATAVKYSLESANGVRSVTVSLVTGSVTIHYDRSRTNTAALFEALRAHGCSTAAVRVPNRDYRRDGIAITVRGRALTPHGAAIGTAVARFLIEKAIERSLMAVLAAVL